MGYGLFAKRGTGNQTTKVNYTETRYTSLLSTYGTKRFNIRTASGNGTNNCVRYGLVSSSEKPDSNAYFGLRTGSDQQNCYFAIMTTEYWKNFLLPAPGRNDNIRRTYLKWDSNIESYLSKETLASTKYVCMDNFFPYYNYAQATGGYTHYNSFIINRGPYGFQELPVVAREIDKPEYAKKIITVILNKNLNTDALNTYILTADSKGRGNLYFPVLPTIFMTDCFSRLSIEYKNEQSYHFSVFQYLLLNTFSSFIMTSDKMRSRTFVEPTFGSNGKSIGYTTSHKTSHDRDYYTSTGYLSYKDNSKYIVDFNLSITTNIKCNTYYLNSILTINILKWGEYYSSFNPALSYSIRVFEFIHSTNGYNINLESSVKSLFNGETYIGGTTSSTPSASTTYSEISKYTFLGAISSLSLSASRYYSSLSTELINSHYLINL